MTILQIAREEAGLRGFELARKANINVSIISQVERGFRKPYPKFRKAVSTALGVSENLLFTKDGSCKTIGLSEVVKNAK